MGHPLNVARKKKKMTQKELARRAGLTNSAVSQIETGKRIGCITTLKALGKALRVDWKTLVEN